MILARFVLATAVSAFVLSFATERAGADHIGRTLPQLEPAGLIFAVTSVDEMTPEMRKAYIRGIQEELVEHRYDPGPADGLFGPKTRQAIRKYQRDARLPVDGVASKELLDHLKFAAPRVYAQPDPEPDPLVLEVQTRLRDLGYHRGALDGQMGDMTRDSIRAYRYDAGLPISGAIDGPLLEHLRPAEPVAESGETSPTDAADDADLPESAEAPAESWMMPEPQSEPLSEPLPETPSLDEAAIPSPPPAE